jgi:SNF2 family DNA or RNA helicase/uncharacterized Zn finger protein
MATYGKTWWGQQWLNSLSKIDYSNRLPRGRAYANKGAVESVTIDGNEISAKVKGSRPRPYSVVVSVPVFTGKQNDQLAELVKANPQILSKLLNKELDPELDKIATANGIRIFPTSWRDFGMNCSCPDSAVPCKHLASVIYMVANEIDKNPFLLLHLHGCDLLKMIALQAGESSGVGEIPHYSSLYSMPAEALPQERSNEALISIDFSLLTHIETDPLQLLRPSPLFYPKDFKELLQKAYKAISKQVKEYSETSPVSQEQPSMNYPMLVVHEIEKNNVHIDIVTEEGHKKMPLKELIAHLLMLEDKELLLVDFTVAFLHKALHFSLRLAEKGLFIPQLWKLENGHFYIRWVPAFICPEVQETALKIINVFPPEMLVIRDGKKKNSSLQISTAGEQLNELCSIFLHYFISSTYQQQLFHSLWYEKNTHSSVLSLFGQGRSNDFHSFELAQVPLSIHQWLGIFEITRHRFVPMIQIEEHEKGFGISVWVSDREKTATSPVELSDVFSKKTFDNHRFEILKDISAASHYFPHLDKIIQNKGKEPLVVGLTEFSEVLFSILPVVKLLGISLLLPKALRNLVRPQLSLQLKTSAKGASVKSLLALSNIIEYDWQVSLGDEPMSFDQFQKMVKGMSGLVKLKGQYIFLDEAEMKALQKNLEKQKELNSFQLLQAILAEEISGVKAGISPDVLKLIQKLMKGDAIALPVNLNATLRPYQVRGYEWMVKNARLNIGSILADDMGLGKTLQVIATLLHFKQQGMLAKNKALVVAPTSLITNWQKEIQRFAPDLSMHIYHGSARKQEFDTADITLTSYGLLRNDLAHFEKTKWFSLIIDEAQNIKNHSTEQTKSVKKVKADVYIAMSGTPVENRLGEYWSIFDFTNKGYLSAFKAFNDSIAKPIHQNHDQSKIDYFKNITAPFIMRRLKTDKTIIADLPDKIENNQYCSLTEKQAALYQSLVDDTMQKISSAEGIERKGLVLSLMMALKQIGNHPFQYLKQGDKDLALSGKTQMLIELLSNIMEVNEKVLIFTQFKEMGDLLTNLIHQHCQEKPLFLHGGLSRNQRDEMVELFQKTKHHRVFILSLKAGGTGLNLTAANHVIHYDLWWNPAVEAQATDRAFRIGQLKNVMVHRLINKGTLEEKIDNMLSEKRKLANLTVSSGETWLGDLKNDELRQLVNLEI